MDDVLAFASVLRLNRKDMRVLDIKDAYSIHRVVYGLFEDTRGDAKKSEHSGILFADKSGVQTHEGLVRQVLMLSDRKPHATPQFGTVETRPILNSFIEHDHYAFTVTVNPAIKSAGGKVKPLKTREDVVEWFKSKALTSWGFTVHGPSLMIDRMFVQAFDKDGYRVVHGGAILKGSLSVKDRDLFKESFTHGVGRGRAFGFGLLQVVPLTD